VTPEWLGRVPYVEALGRMRSRRDAVIKGLADEAFWLLEHESVVTLGRREAQGVDRAALAAAGVAVVSTERGGLATWHGPGQLVGYPIIDLRRRGLGVRAYVSALEAGLIAWLASVGLRAKRRAGAPGVWVSDTKLAAIGIHVRHGVAIHGFALNLEPPSDAFTGIVPCGLREGRPGSVAEWTGAAPRVAEVARDVAAAVLAALVDGAEGRR
jgi:lipoate-protein ligase B